MPFLSIPHNIITSFITFTTINSFAIDLQYYDASNPSKLLLSDILGNKKKIRLLDIEYFVGQFIYGSVPIGESQFRKVINFSATMYGFKLDGINIRDKLTNQLLQVNFNSSRTNINFGNGIIIDDFNLPTAINDIIINNIPPTPNNPNKITMVLILKYNENY